MKFTPIPNFDSLSPQTTKGDLIGRTSAGATRFPVGADGTVVTADSTTALGIKWASASPNLPVNALTGATTLPATSQVLLISGTTFPITPPSPTGNSGLFYRLLKIDSGLVTPISMSGTGLAGITFATQFEEYTVLCDGATYWPFGHNVFQGWISDTSIITPTSFGTISNQYNFYKRTGDSVKMVGGFQAGTMAAATAQLDISTLVFDTTKLAAQTNTDARGRYTRRAQANTTLNTDPNGEARLFWDGADTNSLFFGSFTGATSRQFSKTNAATLFSNNDGISYEFEIPISGWGG